MKVRTGPLNVWLIGDPHLGKKFEVGVPLHRRGEREQRQLALFREELATADVSTIVMVGDLFDHPYVGYAVVKAAADLVLAAAAARPHVDFVMMAGNHDLPRNITHVGAFHAFKQMVEGRYSNLIVCLKPGIRNGLAFFPWEWDRSAAEQVADLEGEKYVAAIGHWDLKSFPGSSDKHLAPVAALGDVALYSGHYHKEGVYRVGGRDVHCCGSMEPYARGEGDLYVTLSREDLLATPAEELRDKCVHVLLRPGEDVPEIDALAITHERVHGSATDDGGAEQLSLATLDWSGILAKKIAPLHPTVKAFITERLSDVGSEEQCGGDDQAV